MYTQSQQINLLERDNHNLFNQHIVVIPHKQTGFSKPFTRSVSSLIFSLFGFVLCQPCSRRYFREIRKLNDCVFNQELMICW